MVLRELRKPRVVTFYKNGDRYFPGKQLQITPHRYLDFNELMNDLTKKLNLPYGVRVGLNFRINLTDTPFYRFLGFCAHS